MQQLKLKKRPAAAKTLSDKIHEQLAPQPVKDVDDSGDEESRPRFSEFDENDAELERAASSGLSEFRKRNVPQLDSVDGKYQGQVSSRKDVFGGSDEVESEVDNDEEESDVDYDEQESEEDNSSDQDSPQQAGAFVRLNQRSETDEDGSEPDEEAMSSNEDDFDDDDENDVSLGDFIGQNNGNVQKLLNDENKQESVQKGVCVQNQLKMWERLLEIRIKLQPSLITANSFPHQDKFNSLSKDVQFKESAEKVVKTVESTLQNLLELQEVLSHRFPESKNVLKGGVKRKLKGSSSGLNDKKQRISSYESVIQENFNSQKQYRNDVIQKWHDRTKASGNIKNAHQSLDIIKKIENALLVKDELIRKTQLYRGGFDLFEKPAPKQSEPNDHQDEQEPEPVYVEEIFDDSDFYHALLRELIEYKSNTTENPQEINAKLAELQRLRNKMKKQVDTRASKGRKIRYVVHKKLVNFTAPEDNRQWAEEAKDELFSSLFGRSSGAEREQ